MTYRLILLLTLLIALPLTAIAAADVSLTIDDAIARGLAANPEVEAYRIAIAEAEAGVKQSHSAFLPTLSVDYGYRRLINNDSGSERDNDYLSQDSDTFSVRLTQPLFSSFGGVAGVERARRSRDYRELEQRYMEQQLVREIRSSFYEFLWARQRVDKWQESVERLLRQKTIAGAWVQQQLAPRLRLLEIETELAHARQQQVSAQTVLATATADLRSWLALPAGTRLDLHGELSQSFAPLTRSVDDYLEQALANRPELQMAKVNIELARTEARVVRARNLPKVTLDAGWNKFDRDYRTSGLPGDERDYYTVSVNLSMRPYQGGATIHAWREQQLKARRFSELYNNQRNNIVAEVETLYQQFAEGQSRLQSAEQGIVTAEEAYQFAEQASRIGTASLDALLNAELRLTRAELDMLDARHQQQQTLIRFEHAVGMVNTATTESSSL